MILYLYKLYAFKIEKCDFSWTAEQIVLSWHGRCPLFFSFSLPKVPAIILGVAFNWICIRRISFTIFPFPFFFIKKWQCMI